MMKWLSSILLHDNRLSMCEEERSIKNPVFLLDSTTADGTADTQASSDSA